jgi:hypothetical protein
MDGVAKEDAMGLVALQSSTLMLLLGMVLLSWVLLRRRYEHRPGSSCANGSLIDRTEEPQVPSQPNSKSLDAGAELARWQVQMHETARDLKAELDSKIGVLQQLVRMAGDHEQRLGQLIARGEQLGLPRPGDVLSEIQQATSQSNGLHSGPNIDGPTGPAASRLPAPSARARGLLSEPTDQQLAVYQLADQGHSAASIAEQVGLPLGEVEMLLSIRRGG